MDLLIPLDSQLKKPLYEQIYAHIRKEIREGNLRMGERLPSTRTLATHLKVSRSTTQMAYDQLLAEGYIEARPYRGIYVAQMEELVEVETPVCVEEGTDGFLEARESKEEKNLVDFSPRGIDLESFPYNVWRKLSRNTLVNDNREMFLSGDHQGENGLREAIRSYLHSARGVNCRAEQIIVGAGSEYLLILLSQILGKNRTIAMENPTYKQAYRVLHSLDYPVCPVDMDGFGMIPELLEQSRADVAYVMPSHQFPTGAVMSVGRRQEMLRWALAGKDRYLIEDDYDSEFRYRGKPIPALQGMDRAGRVIYIGTFSKCIAPAIRVSYLVLPEQLLKKYKSQTGFYASTVSRIDQNILYQFLSRGYFERHLNRMRAIYRAKHDAMLTALRPLEKEFEIHGEYAGIHILLTSRSGRSEEDLIRRAENACVKVYGLSGYFIYPEHNHRPATIVLGYASLNLEEIETGVKTLIECWKA
ncbi:PLP-dependent aminotransferase family protein [Brotaphodocola catenula]|uniref:PLP-dependent aminotransferase family protein n=1 Tax=Brotaphodocola catenula TaxID=2885361 RepID=A0AAE3DHY5_9FIRM|nr:PLP-dependent aminotransferase family protein [Brotaphodocola catenula]MCC2164490.1 PLP-dependent aminotransferase family protein [Brotaphodocola catenula]